jgi:uncharacterized protein
VIHRSRKEANASLLIERLGLQPHPEGGFYKETYRASEKIAQSALPVRYSGDRHFGTAIFYLLTPQSFSALHRVATDEIFHFYLGDPVTVLQLFPDGTSTTVTLGPDILGGQLVQCVVARKVWQGLLLRDGGEFALLGTTLAPGFDFSDFELGKRDKLIAQYRKYEDLITRLTCV